ncbi:MAG: DUF2950 domain-containing protein [Candidatus Acidiferrales bacterium]
MRRMKQNFQRIYRSNLPQLATLGISLLLLGCFPSGSMAQQKGQETFRTAHQASRALFLAVQSDDEKALLAILGPEGKQITSSGDAAEDARNRIDFASKYMELHRLVKEPDGTVTLYIGAENWPTPIPIVEKAGVWFFDTEKGKEEIVMRRVGHNELSAIRVCQELVSAEKEYYSEEHNVYAAKFISDGGQQNGLYWAGKAPESPIGPLVADASTTEADMSRKDEPNGPLPFRGYFFRVLTRQGKDAPGGAKDYIADGKMTGGFAFTAYPAEYRNSGVMTFIVGADGVIYQKDLGEKTVELAKAMKEYNPDSSWQKVEEQMEQSADMQKTK